MTNFMSNSIFFGAALSLIAYEVGLLLKRKIKMAIFNPLLISIIAVIGMRRKKANRKLSKTMAVILGLIVTVEFIIAGGMIFNIDFHSTDMIALFMGFMVLYAGVVALLTDN